MFGAACFACAKRSEPAPPGSARAFPVPAPPAGLLAEAVVREPLRLYPALKQLVGPRAALLPVNFELAVASVLELPMPRAGWLAPGRPLVAAWLLPEGGQATALLGVPLASGAEFARDLARPGSNVRVEPAKQSGITLIHAPDAPKLGVLDDWLLVSSRAEVLALAGPYLARNLARRPLPPEPIAIEATHDALAGPLVAALRQRWTLQRAALAASAEQARAAHGRPADFADPAAVLALGDAAVAALLETLGSCQSLRLTFAPAEDRVELALEFVARPGGLAAQATRELATGPLDALLALPASAVAALLTRAGEKALEAGATDSGSSLRALLGPRLPERDAAAVAEAFASFQRGRGPTAVYALLADRTLITRQDVSDRAQLEPGLDRLLALLRLPAVKGPLEPLLGPIAAQSSELRLSGVDRPLRRMQIVKKSGEAQPGLEALWLVRDTSAALSLAADARRGLLALEHPEPAASLGDDALLLAMARRRSPASFALYANLGLFAPAPLAAPALLSFGKRGESARLEAEVSRAGLFVLASRLVPP